MSNRDSHRHSRRSPPTSLPDHFSRKGYLSVSDLVGPSWCEYNYQYGVLSLSHLPPSQRPATITTEAGQTLTAAPQLVAQKETTLKAGQAVHTVLEREVAPIQIYVETETKEDSWALRLLNLWCDVQALLRIDPAPTRAGRSNGKLKENACVREVPVYGWIHGVLIMGVIDEIEKRSIDLDVTEGQPSKTWASQEEWKKEQLRNKASPKKPKPCTADTKKTSTRTLASFFGSQSEPPPDKSDTADRSTDSNLGLGYFLSDTKTRISSWLPAEEDQFSARMQCMTYRRLFDGLLLGALSQSDSSHARSFDPNATPMDWMHTFEALQLDAHQPLSAAFLRDAEPLCQSWGVDLALFVAENNADVCTLHHIRLMLEQGLTELVRDARRGVHREGESGGENVGVIQDRLALTYRRQATHKRRKCKQPSQTRSQKSEDAKEDETCANGLRQRTLDNATPMAQLPDEDLPNTSLSSLDIGPIPNIEVQEKRKSIDALEGRNDASEAITQALSTPLTLSQSTHPSTPPSPIPAQGPDVDPSPVIGIVTFSHDPPALDKFLLHTISMWKGERQLVGVGRHQTRRCWTCEWIDGCEWRTSQFERDTRLRADVQPAPHTHIDVDRSADEDEFWSTLDYDTIQVRDSAGNLLDW